MNSGRVALFGAGILSVVFAGNIVLGKLAVLDGATTAPGLGDVGEFLTLFGAVVLFIVACLRYEQAQDQSQQDDGEQDAKSNS